MINQQKTKNITDMLDKTINQISGRDLVSTAEMTDLLLDIRLYLVLAEETVAQPNT